MHDQTFDRQEPRPVSPEEQGGSIIRASSEKNIQEESKIIKEDRPYH